MPTPDAALGAFDGHVFVMPVRVYYEDTDAAGLVYYANYLKFAERARSEMLRAIGTSNTRLMAEAGVYFVVRRCTVDLRRPARLDDRIEVRSRLTRLDGASFSAEQRITRDVDDLVTIDVRLACLNMQGRPARIPHELRAAFQNFGHGNER